MDSHRARHVVFWIATFAILWGLLLPSLAPAAHSAPGRTWIDACPSAGVTQLRLDMPQADEVRKREAAGRRPDCVPQADVLAIAAVAAYRLWIDTDPRPGRRPPILTPPPAKAVWPSHASRAPPRPA
ncbi:hypothetical protein [Massilia sp.]|uniref:hypothetical protein n=1 Tax=Massilia sp. TaxID=1882437 RepID=UPI0028B1D9FF|nr:hypothetical protein [Massilia sp.]